MTESLETQLRETLRHEAGRLPDEQLLEKTPASVHRARRFPRSMIAPAAALLVLLVAAPTVWFATRDDAPAAFNPTGDPLKIGVNYVWPDGLYSGTPATLAAEFTRTALGWSDVETAPEGEERPNGPVWTTVRDSEGRELDILTVDVSFEKRAVVQVGPLGATVEPVDGRDAQWVNLSSVPGAASGVVHARLLEPDRLEVIPIVESDLVEGRVEFPTGSPIAGVVIVYLDENGDALTAEAGNFGPFDDSFGLVGQLEDGLTISPLVPLAMPSRHGDATTSELGRLVQYSQGTQPDNEVDLTEVFPADGFVDTALRGRWEGSEEIEESSQRSSVTYTVASLMGFTRMEDTLVFNWTVHRPADPAQSQGVEATFNDGRITSIDVTSPALPYCIGGVETGCRDYDTGEVRAQDPDLRIFCLYNAPTPCRMPQRLG